MNIRQENKFYEEMRTTARAICAPGKGILAADESTGTIGNRLTAIKLENNRANRRAYRQMLFTSEGISKHISGAILFEETLFDTTIDGKGKLVDLLKQNGIIPGIKVDLGTKPLPGLKGDTYTQGLTDLDKRCQEYYKAGARFAKWRAVLSIPCSPISIQENAWGLARYASICQMNGLVPIIEPEILMDGSHDISVCQYWTEKVLAATFKAANDNHIMLDCALLKPNMVVPGQDHPSAKKISAAEIARATVEALQRTVPPSLVGVVFLSGGQSEEEASVNLNAMNALDLGPRPWRLTFSYGRALQASAIKAWGGKQENWAKGQAAFMARARANGAAALGQYKGAGGAGDAGASLYQKGYTY